MSKLTDEILNKYIDNEFSASELREIKEAVENDEDALKRMKALRTVDDLLRQIEVEEAPKNFTEQFMKVLGSASKTVKPKVSYFFVTVVTILSIGVIGVTLLAFHSVEKNNTQSSIEPYIDQIKDFFTKNFSFSGNIIDNNIVTLIGGVLSLILLISTYFMFESHKNFKNKLDNISH